ncbi:hypothetical protein D3C76_1020060 [compost metagenome]
MVGRATLGHVAVGLAQDVQAHQQQVGGDEGLERGAVELGDQHGAEDGADDAWQQQTQEQGLVDVAQLDVGNARQASGEHFGDVHTGAGRSGRGAGAEQEGGGRDAVGHSQRAVDDLGEEAHRHRAPETLAGQGVLDDLEAVAAAVIEEQAPGQEAQQADQDQHCNPHRSSQDGVVVGMRDEVFDGRDPQCFVFGVDRTLAEVEVANLHAGTAPDSGW